MPAPVPDPTVPLVLKALSLAGRDCNPKDAPVCPIEEMNNYTRAVAVEYNHQLLPDHEQLIAFGKSSCKARQAIYEAVCANNLNYALVTQITYHPDANESECPSKPKECEKSNEPTRCYAEVYNDQDISWSSRPEVWGNNECDARNKLAKSACSIGLNPTDLKGVRCEVEKSNVLCPPIWKNCVTQENELTECRLSKIGEINLKDPLTAVGKSRCEATYRVQELACRFQKSPLKDLAGVECQGVGKPSPSTQSSVVPAEQVASPAQ
ncbi:MAG: hypothetical protein H7318_16120 [Oligoflexus sp.]|nr:hypothetical protein [Oligoflexus sp.]